MKIQSFPLMISEKLKNYKFWFVFTPYFWLVLFFFIPLALIFKISISIAEWGMPPYKDLFEFTENGFQINATLNNYIFVFSDFYYFKSYLNSLSLAFTSTLICLVIGFPIAFYVAKSSERVRNIMLIFLIIPFWTSFLLRVYAWKVLLQGNGLINSLLIKFGIIDNPLPLLHNHYAVILGVVYTYLPFMILPLYGYLVKFDLNLIDAAYDLGAKPIKAFFKVILPLSLPGIVAGSMLVFIPVVGEFVIPEMLGGSDRLYFGKMIWEEFFQNRDWPIASALAMSGILFLVVPILIFQKQYEKYNLK
jgi:putrescine transport system permease protein